VPEVRTILLQHKRNPELVNDEHLYSGTLEAQDATGYSVESEGFIQMPFHKMMVMVSRQLRKYPEAMVVMHRTDREGLHPIQLGEETRVLLRDDPVKAIRRMNVQPGQPVRGDEDAVGQPTLRAAYDTLAAAFGERVYLRMRQGSIEDPITGTWKSLAYGPKIGWRIRGDNNKSRTWLPIRLEGVELPDISEDATPDELRGVGDKLAEALASCRWASVDINDLLNHQAERFFLPRAWNQGKWIGWNALNERYERYMKEKMSS
jgi:hypothetical protein